MLHTCDEARVGYTRFAKIVCLPLAKADYAHHRSILVGSPKLLLHRLSVFPCRQMQKLEVGASTIDRQEWALNNPISILLIAPKAARKQITVEIREITASSHHPQLSSEPPIEKFRTALQSLTV